MDLTDSILKFWFGASDLSADLKPRRIWFKSTPDFDRKIHEKFIQSYEAAAAGHLDHMKESQKSCLALIIMLDQFSRNLFRESPKAFAVDPRAREATYHAVKQKFDIGINRVAKLFFYLPLEHSEILGDQELSLKLINAIDDKRISKAAKEHYETILRFGRFPHRNAVLDRENTPEEKKYLKSPPKW